MGTISLLVGSSAILLVTPACSPGTAAQREASAKFAQAEFCPISRVSAVDVVPVPPAPTAIEQDPERLAMWQAASARKEAKSTDHVVAVIGCGERVVYSCWEFWEKTPPRPGEDRLTDAAECREVKKAIEASTASK